MIGTGDGSNGFELEDKMYNDLVCQVGSIKKSVSGNEK